jgi:hypothetical protein
VAVVVVDELSQHLEKVTLVDDDDVVKALLAWRPYQPLRYRVRVRRSHRSPDSSDADGFEFGLEVVTVSRVAVVNQMAWLSSPLGSVNELLPDP